VRLRNYAQPSPSFARLIPSQGGLALECTYDADLIRDLKSRIPADGRRWDPDRKRWLIGAQYGDLVAKLCTAYLGVQVAGPKLATTAAVETRLLRLEYLGRTKDRGNGERSAFGYVDGEWRLIVPESVLRDWFGAGEQRPDEKPTLYAVLGIKSDATAEQVKSAYRRLAFQWHPDVCKEPDAGEQFKLIAHAYQVLSDPMLRRKYDAGRGLEASLSRQHRDLAPVDGYRSPLRCGWVLVEGTEKLGRFVVSRILQWEDISDAEGRVMVSSWPAGADKPEVTWA